MRTVFYALSLLGLVSLGSGVCVAADTNDDELWAALRSGNHVGLMRHALAPGGGDPSDFKIGDRGTQRNLSEGGREQARRIGSRLRSNGIESAEVFSSEWFRCTDTAALLELGPVTTLEALNSFFQTPSRRQAQTKALTEWLLTKNLQRPVILVTHQVNITALTGVYPSSGELVVIHVSDADDLSVVGRIRTE